MIGCQKCGVEEGAGDGLRILPYLRDNPDSAWDWLALCRPCLKGEVSEREECPRPAGQLPFATPTWSEAAQLNNWHRRMLGEVQG